MPSYIAHRFFGERVAKELRDFPGTNNINQHRTAFLWGVQGPDLLFYLPNNQDPFFNSIGGVMHRCRTDRLLNAISKLLIEHKHSPCYSALASYTYGFLCHYCLDKNVHEYVYWRCEQIKDNYKTTSPFGVHIKLETDMDTVFYREFTGGNVRCFKLENELLNKKDSIDAIALFHTRIIEEVYEYSISPEIIKSCIPRFFAREKGSFDPTGIVSWIRLRLKEIRAREYHTFTANWRTAHVRGDVLNKEHTPWHNLWYPEKTFTDSVLDIFERSVKEAAEIIQVMEEHADSGVPFEKRHMVSFDNGNPKYYPYYEND